MLPFRSQLSPPRLAEGYRLMSEPELGSGDLDRLMIACGQTIRSQERWQRVLSHSAWHLGVIDPGERLVGFVRATSDRALNANLWDLLADPTDPARARVLAVLVHAAVARLRREVGGCSISLSAPPEALEALVKVGFIVDPGGIRAMGLDLRTRNQPQH